MKRSTLIDFNVNQHVYFLYDKMMDLNVLNYSFFSGQYLSVPWILFGYSLNNCAGLISRRLTIEKSSPASRVYGRLCSFTEAQTQTLNMFYEIYEPIRIKVKLEMSTGITLEDVNTFIVSDKHKYDVPYKPDQHYSKQVMTGAEQLKLNKHYIDKLCGLLDCKRSLGTPPVIRE